MGNKSQRKGADGERELAAVLQEYGYSIQRGGSLSFGEVPDYAPAIGQFYLQNPDTRYKIGGYPLINGYINLHLKRTRIFVQMYNLLQRTGEKSYFLAPHYPLNPRILKVGLSWNFFD